MSAFRGLLIAVLAVAAVSAHDDIRPPALGAPPRLNLPALQKRTLSNGLRIWMIESHDVPLVQINLVVLSGSAADPADKFGVASLTAAMLDEGAGTRSALDIADALEGLGATLTTASSYDASAVRMNVPVAQLKNALTIMADVALRPSFPAQDLERLRQERLTNLLQARDDPSSIAATAFSRLLYGPTHRYGTGSVGTEATVRALTAEDLKAFHAAHYVPSNAALIVTGDLRLDAAVSLLEAEFGAWKGPAMTAPPLPAAPQVAKRRVVLVDKPGAAQSQIRIGWIGVPRSTPDYYTIEVMNTVLGGSFTSRLNSNLREEHGYTYGASSYFDTRRSAGPFVAAAGVQTDKTAPAVREFFNELTGITKPIMNTELKKAKNYLALSFPGEFETTGELARKLEDLVIYSLPDDTFNQYTARVQAVTQAAARQAAVKYIVPTRFLVVVVGDRKSVEPELRALNLGPIENMTVDEAMGAAMTGITLLELIDYSDHDRAKWKAWFAADPARVNIPFQKGGRFETVGSMLDHIFLVERRHLSRLEGATPPEETGVAPGDLKALFEYADLVRADYRTFATELDETTAREMMTVHVQSGPRDMTRRRLAIHIIFHELRHLAQIAFAARAAGHEPPGQHDLFYAPESF